MEWHGACVRERVRVNDEWASKQGVSAWWFGDVAGAVRAVGSTSVQSSEKNQRPFVFLAGAYMQGGIDTPACRAPHLIYKKTNRRAVYRHNRTYGYGFSFSFPCYKIGLYCSSWLPPRPHRTKPHHMLPCTQARALPAIDRSISQASHASSSSPFPSCSCCCCCPAPSCTTGSGDAESAVRCASAAPAPEAAARAGGGKGAGEGCRDWGCEPRDGVGEGPAEEAPPPPLALLALLARLPVDYDERVKFKFTLYEQYNHAMYVRTRAAEDALGDDGGGLAAERIVALAELLHRLAHGPAVVELQGAEVHARDGGGVVHGQPPLDGRPGFMLVVGQGG